MRRLFRLLVIVIVAPGGAVHADEEIWHGLHPTVGSQPEFVYPFDGRTPKIAAILHNHHETVSPAVVTTVRVNGQPLDPNIEVAAAGPTVIPAFDYGLPSLSSAGVYDGRFGAPPAIGETKMYRFEFGFALAPGATSTHVNQPPTVTVVQDIKFTNLGDSPVLTGPNVYGGILRFANPPAGGGVANVRVEVATPFSPWFSIPVTPISSGEGAAFSFSQALPLRNDWHMRFSADGFESQVTWLGFQNSPITSIDITLPPSPVPEVDYRRISTITTPTGFWRGAISESEGSFVVFPGQEKWRPATSDADARALRGAGRIGKYRFDGTRLWEHAPGWETWAGDMTTDGRYVAYALNPIVRPFHTPAENKLVLLDGTTGAIIWSKSAAPTDSAVGRKIGSVELVFSPDSRWIAIGSVEGHVTLVERATGNMLWTVPGAGLGFGEIQKLRFSPNSEFLYGGSADGALRKLRVSDGAIIWRGFVGGAPNINGMSVTTDGAWIVVGTKSREASVVRTADGFMQWQKETQSLDAITAPDARHVATGGGQIYRTIEGLLVGMTKATGISRFTSDGRHVMQLGRDLRLHDLGGKLLKTFEASGIGAAAGEEPHWAHLSRDGRYAVVLARDMLNPPQTGIAIYERRVTGMPATAPTIVAQPLAQNVTIGSEAFLSVAATGTGPLAYRWQRNGADLAGAESASLSIPRAASSDAGTYTATVTNAAGSVNSAVATIALVAAEPANPARIANLSVRANVGTTPLIVGFAIGGAGSGGTKRLLIRGVGPTLSTFGVPNPLRDPSLALFSGTTNVLSNDNWLGDQGIVAVANQVGAFPFMDNASADAAIVALSVGGSFTVHLAGADANSGIALAEIYDASASFVAATPRLVNISARADTGGGNVLIAGFVVTGPASKTMLVRGIGPTLGQFGVQGALRDSQLTLVRGDVTVAANDNWYDAPNAIAIGVAATTVGAFPLAASSRDAAILVSLPPGSYTAHVSGVGAASGSALVEAYEVP